MTNTATTERLTWCAKKACDGFANLDKNPVQNRNGEVLCPTHGEEELARR